MTTWRMYKAARKNISLTGGIILGTTSCYLHLCTTCGVSTISTLNSIAGQLTSAYKYKLSGKAITAMTWTWGSTSAKIRFDSTSIIQSASGGTLANIKGAIIVARTGTSAKATANKLLCFCTLSSVTVTAGNTLTITPAAAGIFNLA